MSAALDGGRIVTVDDRPGRWIDCSSADVWAGSSTDGSTGSSSDGSTGSSADGSTGSPTRCRVDGMEGMVTKVTATSARETAAYARIASGSPADAEAAVPTFCGVELVDVQPQTPASSPRESRPMASAHASALSNSQESGRRIALLHRSRNGSLERTAETPWLERGLEHARPSVSYCPVPI